MVASHSTTEFSSREDLVNRWLIVVFGTLIVYVAICYVLVLVSIPIFYQRVVTQTVPTVVVNGETTISNDLIATEATARGMALPLYAAYNLALNLLVAAGFVLCGALILWKAQGNWFRWMTAFVLLFFPLGTMDPILRVSSFGYNYALLGSLFWPAFLLFLYLFPNGRAVPRWSRWPMVVFLTVHFLIQTVGMVASLVRIPDNLWQTIGSLFVIVLACFAFILFCQVYRFLFASTPVERAQIKWFVAGLALLVAGAVADALISGQVLHSRPGFSADLNNVFNLVIPASIALAILRYRLFDIDVIIRKTLVYTVLSGLLALVYFGIVVLLQSVFDSVSGQQSPIAIVMSTLVIAALFAPLRRRVQSVIDRRFFRKKYDAQQVLAQFAITARDETDMDKLTAELIRAIQETMQPEQVNIWLKPATDDSRNDFRNV